VRGLGLGLRLGLCLGKVDTSSGIVGGSHCHFGVRLSSRDLVELGSWVESYSKDSKVRSQVELSCLCLSVVSML
jgi:hypothetical protein